jgi:hypothetical protein
VHISITREARRFAVLEIATRAGLNPHECLIEVSDAQTSLYLDRSRNVEVVFPHLMRQFERNTLHTVRCSWISTGGSSRWPLVPDFIIPSCPETAALQPLFVIEDRRARCMVDLGASVLFSLSRIEERLSTDRDQHGRFPASASVAVRDDYVHRPIVDEYGFAIGEAIQYIVPAWRPQSGPFRAFVTQDVDSIGIPFNPWSTARRLVHTLNIGRAVRDMATAVGGGKPAELESVREIATLAARHGLRSASFWKTGARTEYDTGYDVSHSSVTRVVSDLRTAGVDIGIHPSYYTFENRCRLAEEVRILREHLGQECVGGRQHYLRWSPRAWLDWESCGLAYDSSVGFAERPGFRAGTAVPYQPWLLEENRQARLLEIPLILMDRTLSHYMRLSDSEAISVAADLISRVKCVGGVFTLLWHNELLFNSQYRSLYVAVLQQLAGAGVYDLDSEVPARRVKNAA